MLRSCLSSRESQATRDLPCVGEARGLHRGIYEDGSSLDRVEGRLFLTRARQDDKVGAGHVRTVTNGAPSGLRRVLGVLALLLTLGLTACATEEAPSEPPLFERLAPEATGVDFVNHLPEDPSINILNYLYYYNGGGVAVGDVTGNGYPDLYFTSNLDANRLYENQGDYRFADITEQAGVGGPSGWSSGATMADVNGDGHLDLYVAAVNHLDLDGRNILYINNGDGTFTDRTAAFGLEHEGYSTQAAFFDFTGNGYLDMYLLNHAVHTEDRFRGIGQRQDRHPRSGDRLFRNDGGTFTDVSEEAGIYGGPSGYGLGLAVSDVNRDGCLDIYVGNDFHENDFLYRNNCDGTFTETIADAMGHTSYFTMGVDAADINNDGRVDLAALDMQPEREDILKTSVMAEGHDTYRFKRSLGYHPQYARNTLQLNRGLGRFSDIGYLAGIHATDWSWSALFADLDNSGRKDLFISNGIYRRPNDLDYISYISNQAIQASLEQGITEENLTLLEQMPQIRIPNYAYQNNGDLTFTNRAEDWGLADPGFSNGTAYVDLNNNGALDLVTNNINEPAGIYRNQARERNGHHYLKVALEGTAPNTGGIGAKVEVYHDGQRQLLEQMPTRGFQSSVDHRLHFGLGASDAIDSLRVIWPDARMQTRRDMAVDQQVTLRQEDATDVYRYKAPTPEEPLFEPVPGRRGLDVVHQEGAFIDYNREPFLTQKLSREGPALAVGDVTGNGLDDVYVGGAKGQAGVLYHQQVDGTFTPAPADVFADDRAHEDVHAVFFDATGNGALDLYVVSAGNEHWGTQEPLRDRLYVNDGTGAFTRDEAALPTMFANGSVAVPGDFTGDGALDLFVGGRVVARAYGAAPESFLLANDGTGRFTDVTAEVAPQLQDVGMVTDAVWTDYTQNGRLDLVVVGEWMPVTLLAQAADGRFEDRTATAGFEGTEGWWYSVAAADLSGNGYDDLVLGNLGLNSYIRATPDEPARLYRHDFGNTGRTEALLTFYKADGTSYPLYGRDRFVQHLPGLRSQYPTHTDFADARVEDIFPRAVLRQAEVSEARQFASLVAYNAGDGTFALKELPVEAQMAPVRSIMIDDLTGTATPEVLLAGNFHDVLPLRGRYDASYGVLLQRQDATPPTLAPVPLRESGLVLTGQVRHLRALRTADDRRLLVAARNDTTVQVLRLRHATAHTFAERVEPQPHAPINPPTDP